MGCDTGGRCRDANTAVGVLQGVAARGQSDRQRRGTAKGGQRIRGRATRRRGSRPRVLCHLPGEVGHRALLRGRGRRRACVLRGAVAAGWPL